METLQILRDNDRNISRECKEDGFTFFLKQSKSEESNAADEFYFWKYFKNISNDEVPNCLYFNRQKKYIAYEWLENYVSIDGKYSPKYLKIILDFLSRNCKINTFSNLFNDAILKSLSSQKCQKQLEYYSSAIEPMISFLYEYIDVDSFRKSFIVALSELSKKDVLCHGDLGKSNILVDGSHLKVIDYEYAMFSARELDYGRLVSGIFWSFLQGQIQWESFSHMLSMILDNDLDTSILCHMTGLQISIRALHGQIQYLKSDKKEKVTALAVALLSQKNTVNLGQDKIINIISEFIN